MPVIQIPKPFIPKGRQAKSKKAAEDKPADPADHADPTRPPDKPDKPKPKEIRITVRGTPRKSSAPDYNTHQNTAVPEGPYSNIPRIYCMVCLKPLQKVQIQRAAKMYRNKPDAPLACQICWATGGLNAQAVLIVDRLITALDKAIPRIRDGRGRTAFIVPCPKCGLDCAGRKEFLAHWRACQQRTSKRRREPIVTTCQYCTVVLSGIYNYADHRRDCPKRPTSEPGS